MGDGPKKRGKPRASEIITTCFDPERTLAHAREKTLDKFFACIVVAQTVDSNSVKTTYVKRGFRLLDTQPLFLRDVAPANEPLPANVRRTTTNAELTMVEKFSGKRQLCATTLGDIDPPIRLHTAWQDGSLVGYVKSVRTPFGGNWVSDLFVSNEHRRKGIATALMQSMLAEDFRLGVKLSVLLSSRHGRPFYPTLGYKLIGSLLLVSPPRI